eukprot:9468761-Pyramimonas_sp.AAC.1
MAHGRRVRFDGRDSIEVRGTMVVGRRPKLEELDHRLLKFGPRVSTRSRASIPGTRLSTSDCRTSALRPSTSGLAPGPSNFHPRPPTFDHQTVDLLRPWASSG